MSFYPIKHNLAGMFDDLEKTQMWIDFESRRSKVKVAWYEYAADHPPDSY